MKMAMVGEMEDNQITVLQKALSVFETLTEHDKPQTLGNISQLAGVNPATTYRILATLKDNGWVAKHEQNRYSIDESAQFFLSRNHLNGLLREVAHEPMRESSYAESQPMNLIVRNYEKCMILQQIRTGKTVDYVPPIGTELPIYASSGGKVLLSELPLTLLQSILQIIELKPLSKYTITRKIDFVHELRKVKANGYGLDIHESLDKGCCIAVPVRNPDGRIIAAVSFSGFIGNFDESDIAHYYPILHETANKIARRLQGCASR